MSLYKTKKKAEKKRNRKKEKNSKSERRWKATRDRHANRRALLGRQTEDRVALLLEKKQKQGELVSFMKHPAFSPEDMAGKDFTVSQVLEGQIITVSFGVTISPPEYHDGNDVPLIQIPPEMSDERIWQRICQICGEAK